jgi:2-desacetyl-2-hydroxyethyl bacteriochlorophyllide A dehydrogenase
LIIFSPIQGLLENKESEGILSEGILMKIPDAMKAVVVHGIRDYRYEEIPVPRPGPGEVLVKVRASGICAGDVKTFHGHRVWGSEEIAPYIEVPVVPGHECIGEVVELGEGAGQKYSLQIGDLAVSEQIIPCWKCRFCLSGQYWMCAQHDIYGFKKGRAEGSWAEYMLYPANAINHKVSSDIEIAHAALIEPVACAIHAVERGNIRLNDVVVIAGMGPIGLCMLQVAKLMGAGFLIVTDVRPNRLEIARELGADMVINVNEEDPVDRVKQLTDGYGCDVFIEVAGVSKAVYQGLQMTRNLGTIVEFSVHTSPVSVDWSIIGDVKELNIHGAHLGPYSYPKAIQFIHDGRVKLEKVISHTVPLNKYQEALEMASSREESLKIVLFSP